MLDGDAGLLADGDDVVVEAGGLVDVVEGARAVPVGVGPEVAAGAGDEALLELAQQRVFGGAFDGDAVDVGEPDAFLLGVVPSDAEGAEGLGVPGGEVAHVADDDDLGAHEAAEAVGEVGLPGE
ncbi:MAG: hypothetical protein R3B49_03135 [Phycisphaerales bacterium]